MSAIIHGAAFNPATERVSWSSIQVSSDPIPVSQALAPHSPAQANNSHQFHPQATHPPSAREQPGKFTPNFLGSTKHSLQNSLSNNQATDIPSGKFPWFSLPEAPFAAIVQATTNARRPPLHQAFPSSSTTRHQCSQGILLEFCLWESSGVVLSGLYLLIPNFLQLIKSSSWLHRCVKIPPILSAFRTIKHNLITPCSDLSSWSKWLRRWGLGGIIKYNSGVICCQPKWWLLHGLSSEHDKLICLAQPLRAPLQWKQIEWRF